MTLCCFFFFIAMAYGGTLSCYDLTDYHILLFRICEKSIHCSRIYYIDPILDTSNFTHMQSDIKKLHDFDRFNHQMERVTMFDVYNFTLGEVNQNLILEKEKILTTMLPPEWFIDTQILLTGGGGGEPTNSSSYCSESYNMTEPENRLFIYSALMSLQTFKLFISEEYSCADPNEKLYMTGDGTFKCICSKGKSCNNESNFSTILIVLIVVSIFSFSNIRF